MSPASATTIIGTPGISGALPRRSYASYRMNTAIPSSRMALTPAVKTSARCHPYVRAGELLPLRASTTAVSPMNNATRSVSMCPASASSAIELIASAVPSSMKKKPVRMAAASDHPRHPSVGPAVIVARAHA